MLKVEATGIQEEELEKKKKKKKEKNLVNKKCLRITAPMMIFLTGNFIKYL
jgi:hypothetical protein